MESDQAIKTFFLKLKREVFRMLVTKNRPDHPFSGRQPIFSGNIPLLYLSVCFQKKQKQNKTNATTVSPHLCV